MDQGTFSTSVIEGWVDQIEDTPKWLAIFSSDPWAVADPTTVEVAGDTYVRINATWLRTDVRALTLDSAAIWRSLPPGTVVAAIGAFDDAFAGTVLFRSMLLDPVSGNPAPVAFPTGGTFKIDAGEYVIGVDVPLL